MSVPEETPYNRQLVTAEVVKAGLKAEKGDAARLVSYRVEDFTKKGDNYACIVTGVVVKYILNNEEKETKYVAKIPHPPSGEATFFMDMMGDIFEKESTCYMDIAERITETLRACGQHDIRFPKGYAKNLEKQKEVIILEDLRPRGFKMYDRKRGLDAPHATLVLKELGRLHAGSFLMIQKLPIQDATKTWPILVDKWSTDDSMNEFFQKMMVGQIEGVIMIVEKFPNYENVVKWLKEQKSVAHDIFMDSFKFDPQWSVLVHGDCWNNNMLFRYDDNGRPVEVMLVDLQGMRNVSVAIDLSYFLYSSFNGSDRKGNLKTFLDIYYESLSEVFQAAKAPVPFSREELDEEFRRQMIYGCLSGMFLIPIVLSEAEDVMDMVNLTEGNVEKFSQDRKETVLKMSERSDGLLRPRLLDMFDEMVEAGVIPK